MSHVSRDHGTPPTTPLSQLPPVPTDQMLVLVNHYIKSTVDTLDKFASSCHLRLDEISDDLSNIESMLAMVESALPPLPPLPPTSHSSGLTLAAATSSLVPNESPIRPVPPKAATAPPRAKLATPQPAPQVSSPPSKDVVVSPAVAKYTAMLRVGVPREAVLNKMDLDKMDRNLLP